MKKLLKVSLFALMLGLCINLAFAAQSLFGALNLTYAYADPQNCPENLVASLHKNPLQLVFGREGARVELLGTNIVNTSISPRIAMGAEGIDGFYAYMSTDKTTLTIDSVTYTMQQLWIQASKDNPNKWISAFYLGENRECLVASGPDVSKNSLATPALKKNR